MPESSEKVLGAYQVHGTRREGACSRARSLPARSRTSQAFQNRQDSPARSKTGRTRSKTGQARSRTGPARSRTGPARSRTGPVQPTGTIPQARQGPTERGKEVLSCHRQIHPPSRTVPATQPPSQPGPPFSKDRVIPARFSQPQDRGEPSGPQPQT